MRVRTALIGLGTSLAVLIVGCSSTIPGSPQAAGGGTAAVTGGSGGGTTGPGGSGGSGGDTAGGSATAGGTGGPASTAAGGGSGGSSGAGGGATTGGGGDSTGIPGLSGLPTELSELSNIPGVNNDCLAVASAAIAIGLLIAAPALGGQPLTKDQVDQAFKGLDSAPAAIQPAIKTLHDAAIQAVGKSPAEALSILGSDTVSKAMDTLSQYSDKQCGNG
jgi:hypothetical protein